MPPTRGNNHEVSPGHSSRTSAPRRDRQAERNQQVESEGPPVRHGFRIAEFCRRNSVGRSFGTTRSRRVASRPSRPEGSP